MLEKDWGKKALEPFLKIKAYAEEDGRYMQWTKQHFNAIGQPQYVVINKDGRITAYMADIRIVMEGGDETVWKKNFQALLDTRKNDGFEFRFKSGFLTPEQQK